MRTNQNFIIQKFLKKKHSVYIILLVLQQGIKVGAIMRAIRKRRKLTMDPKQFDLRRKIRFQTIGYRGYRGISAQDRLTFLES